MSEVSIDIRALAKLARIAVSDEEVNELEQEIPGILAFVATVQEVAGDNVPDPVAGVHRNQVREDAPTHALGEHARTLLEAAPAHTDTHVKVKQVITGGKHKA